MAEKASRDAKAKVLVSVGPTTLLEAVCVCLESDEFVQIRGQVYDEGAGRCAYGVIAEVLERAGIQDWNDPAVVSACHAAAKHLGYASLDQANDMGVSFGEIAQALRATEIRD